jgi:DNA gyrase subunit A
MLPDRFEDLRSREQFILTVCANGYGKLSSAYDYRRTGRGGQGITNIDNIARNGDVVASFPAGKGHQLMLVTNQAKLIRTTLASLRVISRNSAGVKLFDVAKGEHVVSAARIEETEEDAEINLADGNVTIARDTGAVIGDDAAAGPADGE